MSTGLADAMTRQMDAAHDMVSRSGPVYELDRVRGKAMHAAYRAAGSPSHVTAVSTPAGQRYFRVKRREAFELATLEEWEAWRSWASGRDRLRRATARK